MHIAFVQAFSHPLMKKIHALDITKKHERLKLPGHADILDHSKYPKHPNIRLVIIGKTGEGRSSTANTILGRPNCFREGDTSHAVTTALEIGSTVWGGQKITIVDTPGLQDPNRRDPDEINGEFRRIFERCPEGIHGFLHVKKISNPRFTEDDEHVTSVIEKTFGEKMTSHTILVYTHVESKMHDEFCLKDFCDQQRSPGGREGGMARYMGRLSWRIFAIDNKANNYADRDIYRRNLVAAANKMIALNGPNSIYGREALERALSENISKRSKNFPPENVAKAIRANPQITDEELVRKVLEEKEVRDRQVWEERKRRADRKAENDRQEDVALSVGLATATVLAATTVGAPGAAVCVVGWGVFSVLKYFGGR